MSLLPSLTGWDWFVVIVTLVSVLSGMWRGLVRTVFGLAAWVVALVVTGVFAPTFVPGLGMYQHPWVVFIVLFIATFVLVRALGWLVARTLARAGLGSADRLLGAAIGLARALLVILIVAIGARVFELDRGASWERSWSRPLLERMLTWAEPYLPGRVSGIRQT